MKNYNNTKGNGSEDKLMEDNNENGIPNSQTKAGNKKAQVIKEEIVQEKENKSYKEMQRRIKEMQRSIKEIEEMKKEKDRKIKETDRKIKELKDKNKELEEKNKELDEEKHLKKEQIIQEEEISSNYNSTSTEDSEDFENIADKEDVEEDVEGFEEGEGKMKREMEEKELDDFVNNSQYISVFTESVNNVEELVEEFNNHPIPSNAFKNFQTSNPSKESPAYKYAHVCLNPVQYVGFELLGKASTMFDRAFLVSLWNVYFKDESNTHLFHQLDAYPQHLNHKGSLIGGAVFGFYSKGNPFVVFLSGVTAKMAIGEPKKKKFSLNDGEFELDTETIQSILTSQKVNLLRLKEYSCGDMDHLNLVLHLDDDTRKVIYVHLSYHRFIENRIEYCSIFEKENPSIDDLARVFDTLHKTNLFNAENEHSFLIEKQLVEKVQEENFASKFFDFSKK